MLGAEPSPGRSGLQPLPRALRAHLPTKSARVHVFLAPSPGVLFLITASLIPPRVSRPDGPTSVMSVWTCLWEASTCEGQFVDHVNPGPSETLPESLALSGLVFPVEK